MNLVIKDAARQIAGRVASAIGGFLVIKMITPYLGPLRFGDYSTILKYFAIWSAFADFGVYVIALKELGAKKKELGEQSEQVYAHSSTLSALHSLYSKFVTTRFFMVTIVYTLALVIAYLIPAYSSNPYLIRGLPLGMVFSASFMSAGIVQIPLQLFWKMEQVSIALIVARIAQLTVIGGTVYRWFTNPGFDQGLGQDAFMMIIFSVVVSGLIQMCYTWRQGSKYLSFTWSWDRGFIKNLLGSNWQYGVAYYLSSFHTLLVLMIFSWLYPTTEGWTYVGIRALALSLVEILLIVPSALGNSMIHDVSGQTRAMQKDRYSALLKLVVWIGGIIVIMSSLFAPHVIQFMGGSDYLTTTTAIGSDYILPFLAFVLMLSFIKQVHNYLFVTTGHQNTLLGINLFGVVVGLLIGLPLIIQHGMAGGIITQIILEILFVGGSLRVAHRHQISLQFPWKVFGIVVVAGGVSLWYLSGFLLGSVESLLVRIALAGGIFAVMLGVSWRGLKRTMRKL